MRRFRVVAAAILSLSLVAALAGCGTTQPSTTKAAESKPAASEPAKTPAPAKAPTALELIKQKGVITIGTSNDVPFAYMEPNTSKLKGIDAEFIMWMAEKMGVKVEVYVTEFSTLIPALMAKKFDIITDAMYVTDKRKEQINFTDPWYKEGEGLVVLKDDNAIKSIADLKGKMIGAQTGTVFLDFAKTLGAKEVKVYDSQATALLDLNNKRIDAVITDSATSAYAIGKDPTLKLKLVSPYEANFAGTIGAGIRKEDTDLLNEVNRLLKDLKAQNKDLEILKNYGLGPDNRMP